MSGNLVQFGEDLHPQLLRLQVSLNNINGLFASGSMANEAELASRLEELRTSIAATSERAEELRDMLHAGLARDVALAPETLSGWVGRRQTAQLHARADLIEQLAAMAVELARLSATEAERTTIAAILARRQAVAVQVQREDRL